MSRGLVSALVGMVLCLGGCAGRTSSTASPGESVQPADHDGIVSQLAVRRAGSALNAIFTVLNHSGRPRAFRFRSSQIYDFLVLDTSGAKLWKWSDQRVFAMMLTDRELAGQPWVFEEELPDLAPGRYILKAWLADHPEIGAEVEFEVK